MYVKVLSSGFLVAAFLDQCQSLTSIPLAIFSSPNLGLGASGRARMMAAEYLVCLATFASIQAWGVEKGMLAGLVLAAVSFTVTYAQASD